MFPLWDEIVAPVIEAVRPKTIVEIGALRGENTVHLLEELGPEAELHVIDPVPEFDPTEHETRFPGRYVFHRDISHNVLPELPAVDVAIIDGDHNWYTVYHELRLLTETSRRTKRMTPVMIMHDVLWPYGRRDLYYSPENIPKEFRHEYARRGMQRGRKDLVPEGRGGISPTLNNAVIEGGERNGVLTALEDFVSAYQEDLRVVILPIFFGLAVVTSTERVAATPELGQVLDRLESREGRLALLELSENLRLDAVASQHNFFYGTLAKIDRGAERYLNLLKGALLNQHYLENEVRLWYLLNSLKLEETPDLVRLEDPVRYLRSEMDSFSQARRSGESNRDGIQTVFYPYAAMGEVRLDRLQACLDLVRSDSIAGDLMECGTDRGGGAIFMRGYLEGHEIRNRRVWVSDTFGSVARRDVPTAFEEPIEPPPAARGNLNTVRDGFARFGLLDETVKFLHGEFGASLPTAPIEKLAVLRVATPSYEEVRTILDHLYDKVEVGGFIVFESYYGTGCEQAFQEFKLARGVESDLERVDWSAALLRKEADPLSGTSRNAAPIRPASLPLAHPVKEGRKDLSVVVCFYNMRREAERTLYSLSRAYQRDIADLSYEVIAVENGSNADEALGDAFVKSFGPEFTYVDMGPDARSSPVHALNVGIANSSGDNIAVMIDGAHVLTPGVLHLGMAGLKTYAPAVVATQQWYVGPGQQNEVMQGGYDKSYEDRLFEAIGWPNDGYRLFDVGHFIGDRDWFDGLWESNCLFVPRKIFEQIGCIDENFSMPGGEYANLDLYERVTTSPGVKLVSMLGEGSFHQVHGGTTTNEADVDARKSQLDDYREHYAELRGRALHGPAKQINYVGSLVDSARRTARDA